MRTLPITLLVLAAGCETYRKPAPVSSHEAAPAAAPTPAPDGGGSIETATFAPELQVDLKTSTKTASGLYYRDLTVGTGAEVARGQQVSVHYAGWLADGHLFDQSGPDDPPLTFSPGAGRVIPGWEEGVVGMKVGGKRQLVVPSALGYGAAGNGPIPPNAIMVFTVDVVTVR